MKNRVLETIKNREKNYTQLTEQAIGYFINDLKAAMENSLFKDSNIELFINDVAILPQNFRFCRIEGRVALYSIGDKISVNSEDSVEIGLENFWDFAEIFTVVIPFSLLDEPDVDKLVEYFNKVKENGDKIPDETIKKLKKEEETNKDFLKVNKDLDDIQKLSMKIMKNSSVH